MAKQALIVWGGWKGHTPKESAELFAQLLGDQGFEVEVSDTLDSYLDEDKMKALSLVVPLWTMGEITKEQEKGLTDAIESGVGLGGFHGGMCDSFRNNVKYQWMTGGQWVAHPGDIIERYPVNITDAEHEITKGIGDFEMRDTEQYWLHVCPSNHVLATTPFPAYDNMIMPYAWTRKWGEGRVFFAAWGHTFKDFEIEEAREMTVRGMVWASR